MSSRGKNKRDSSSLDEIPNFIIEYDRVDFSKKCPRFFKLTNNGHKATLGDLDLFQVELEILLTDAMKRLRILKNEYKPKKENKIKNFDDKSRNYDKSQANKISSKNKSNTKCGVIDTILKSQLAPSNNDVPCRFWNQTQNYDLNLQDLNIFFEYLSTNLSVNLPNENGATNDLEESDDKKVLFETLLRDQDNATKESTTKRKKLGLNTQRLLSSFVPIEGNSLNNELMLEVDKFTDKIKQLNQSGINFIEKSINSDLEKLQFATKQEETSNEHHNGVLCELTHKLTSQSEANRKSIEEYLELAKLDCAKAELSQHLKSLQLESLENYKDLRLSEMANGSIAKQREKFDKILDKKDRLVLMLRSFNL